LEIQIQQFRNPKITEGAQNKVVIINTKAKVSFAITKYTLACSWFVPLRTDIMEHVIRQMES